MPAKKSRVEMQLVKLALLKAAFATIAILSVFVALNSLSYYVSSSVLPFLVLLAGLVLIAALFIALQGSLWFSGLKRHPRQVAFIVVQATLLVFFALELFQALEIDFESKTFGFSSSPTPYLFMGLVVLVLFLLNFALKKKNSFTFAVQQDAKFVVKETAKIKARRAKKNPYPLVLFVFELAYVLIIAYAISYHFNPNEELIPWNKLGSILGVEIKPPITTLFHIAGFMTLTAVLLLLNDYARQFDSLKFQGCRGFKKLGKPGAKK